MYYAMMLLFRYSFVGMLKATEKLQEWPVPEKPNLKVVVWFMS